jgi:hypothetical protein
MAELLRRETKVGVSRTQIVRVFSLTLSSVESSNVKDSKYPSLVAHPRDAVLPELAPGRPETERPIAQLEAPFQAVRPRLDGQGKASQRSLLQSAARSSGRSGF